MDTKEKNASFRCLFFFYRLRPNNHQSINNAQINNPADNNDTSPRRRRGEWRILLGLPRGGWWVGPLRLWSVRSKTTSVLEKVPLYPLYILMSQAVQRKLAI